VHTYDRPSASPDPLPSIAEFPFNDALDVVAYAEVDLCIGWNTWPEVWHLDETGVLACAYKASSCESLVGWAQDPWQLERSRREGLASAGGCADRWLIVDSRPTWLSEPPNEADARAFIELRAHLQDSIAVELVDAVVFDDDGHWWSMHELTSGTTEWSPAPVTRRVADQQGSHGSRAPGG